MKKIYLPLLFLAISTLTAPRLGEAQSEISILSSAHEIRFTEETQEIMFKIEAKSGAEITKITLFYGVKGVPSRAYAYPTFTPGKTVKAEYSLKANTQKTYIPPASDLRYYWLIEDAAGNKLQSEATAFTYEDVRFEWKTLTKDGITLYWYKFRESFAQELLDEAVKGLERLSAQVGIDYQRPMRILVYENKRDMDPALQKRSETFSREMVTLGTRVSPEVMLLLGNHPEVKQTIAHELSHMVIHQATEGAYSHLPAWLDEGLAMNAEQELPERYRSRLNAAILRDELISVRSLSAYVGDPNQVNLFYAEAYSVVKFLLDTHGKGKMVELLKAFEEGSPSDDALLKVYSFDTEGLDAAWRTSLGLKPRPTRKTPGEAQPIPTLVPFGVGKVPLTSAPFIPIVPIVGVVAVAALAATATILLLRHRS